MLSYDCWKNDNPQSSGAAAVVDASFIEFLKEMRYGNETEQKKKLNVAPGKSITGKDFDESSNDDTEASDDEKVRVDPGHPTKSDTENNISDDDEQGDQECSSFHLQE